MAVRMIRRALRLVILPLSLQLVTKTYAHPNLTTSFRQAIISCLSSSSFYERVLWSTGQSMWKFAYPKYLGIERSDSATRHSQRIQGTAVGLPVRSPDICRISALIQYSNIERTDISQTLDRITGHRSMKVILFI